MGQWKSVQNLQRWTNFVPASNEHLSLQWVRFRPDFHVGYVPARERPWIGKRGLLNRKLEDNQMMTIRKRYHGPRFNWRDLCDLCGAPYERSNLFLDPDHRLLCASCKEKSPMELDRINAANGTKPIVIEGKSRRR